MLYIIFFLLGLAPLAHAAAIAAETTASTAASTAVSFAAESPLGRFHVDEREITVSGVSSGAFMAIQLEVAFSRTISGAGSVAGGIYSCAEGSAQTAQVNCMAIPNTLQTSKFVELARRRAEAGEIDPLENLVSHRLFIFAGKKDTVIQPLASSKLKEFYDGLVDGAQIRFENQLVAVHGFPTLDFGNPCNVQTSPWMINCGYDAAGEILKTMYGSLEARGRARAENLHRFSQKEFGGADIGLYSYGYIYVPSACERGATCRLHVALHGCVMNPDSIQEKFVTHAGYNEWAEGNNIIVLYPQATKIQSANPYGCWDWWGYTGADYASRTGKQMQVLKSMIDRVSGGQ